MSSTRSVIAPPVFADNALTVIPPTPVAGVSYRDPITGPASSEDGWPYAERVNSAEWNQIMYQISSLVALIDKKGILGWSSDVDYTEAGIAFGSDGIVYRWLLASGPNNGGAKDPAASANPTYWAPFATGGRLVRTTIYINTAGTLQSSVDGAAFANASSTFTKHPDAVFAEGEACGSGGGGGTAAATAAGQVSAGSGGGGGGYARKRALIAAFNGLTIAVGAGVASAVAGNSSSIGGLISATGGAAGATGPNTTTTNIPFGISQGGIGSGGDINARGQQGGYGWYTSTPQQGNGGGSFFGFGPVANGGVPTTGSIGVAAESYGAGGSGGANGASVPTNTAGGASKSGIVIIREYAA